MLYFMPGQEDFWKDSALGLIIHFACSAWSQLCSWVEASLSTEWTTHVGQGGYSSGIWMLFILETGQRKNIESSFASAVTVDP